MARALAVKAATRNQSPYQPECCVTCLRGDFRHHLARALAEPLAVALHAIKVSAAAPDEPVCVLGSGPIGVLTVAALVAGGYGRWRCSCWHRPAG